MGNILVTGRGVVNEILGVGVSGFAGLHSVDARLALHCIALPCLALPCLALHKLPAACQGIL